MISEKIQKRHLVLGNMVIYFVILVIYLINMMGSLNSTITLSIILLMGVFQVIIRFFLEFGYMGQKNRTPTKRSWRLIFYSKLPKLKSLFLGKNASLHFFVKLTNPLLPYTIRLSNLNLLLFPSTNPELMG